MTSIPWDEFKGDYIKWIEDAQVEEGTVEALRIGSYQGRQYPELLLNGRWLSASQVNLKRQLAEDPPEVGDFVRVKYLGEGEARPGQSAVKLFEVTVRHFASGKAEPPPVADLA
jgi:hypothetical protein